MASFAKAYNNSLEELGKMSPEKELKIATTPW